MILGGMDLSTVGTFVFSAVTAAATVVLAVATWKAVGSARVSADAARD
jgi:hypothetical protein